MSSQFSSQINSEGNDGSPYNIPVQPTSHFSLKNQKTASIIVTRSQGKFTPKNQGTFGPGDIMRIEIPSTQWLNTEEFGIAFDIKVIVPNTPNNTVDVPPYLPSPTVANSAHYIRHKNGIQSIFNRVKFMAGSSIPLEDIQEYHILSLMLMYSSAPKSYVDNYGFNYEGMHSGWDFLKQQTLNQWTAPGVAVPSITRHNYFIRPHLGLFRTGKFLPMGYLGLITFEFYFNNVPNCLLTSCRGSWANPPMTGEAVAAAGLTPPSIGPGRYYWTATNPFSESTNFALPMQYDNNGALMQISYVIENVFAHCVWINPREELNNAIMEKLKSGSGINLYFDTFRNSQRQISNAWSGEQTILIQERVASLKGVLMAMINQGDYGSFGREIRFNHNNITKYRWRIGDTYYPQTDIICNTGGIEPYIELLRCFGMDGKIECDNLIRYENYRPDDNFINNNYTRFSKNCPTRGVGHSDRFIIGFNTENSLGQLSGIDTLRMNSDIEFRYTLDAATGTNPAATYQNFVHVIPECSLGYTLTIGPPPVNITPVPPPAQNNWCLVPYFLGLCSDSFNQASQPVRSTIILRSGTVAVAGGVTYGIPGVLATAGGAVGTLPWWFSPLVQPQTDEGYGGIQVCRNHLGLARANNTNQGGGWVISGANFAPVGCFLTDGSNTGSALVDQGISSAMDFLINTYTPCVLPTYYTWYIFTHFDAVLQIKTFGTVVATTDIFQL